MKENTERLLDWYVLELLFILNKSKSKHFIQEFWIQI